MSGHNLDVAGSILPDEYYKDLGLVSHGVESSPYARVCFAHQLEHRQTIDAANKKQFETDCKAMCGNCPGESVELSQDGELWEHDTNESYGPLQCFATPIRRAWEERTGQE